MALLPLAACLVALFPGLAQQGAEPGATGAEELWTRFLAASGSRAETPPITSFHVQAEVRVREGVHRNDLETEYLFLAPDCIRFRLTAARETGKSGPRQRDYWLRDQEEVVELVGADFEKDRRSVDRMQVVAQNFVALSDPAKLRIERCERLPAPPADVTGELARSAAKLAWLRASSPGFALIPRAGEDLSSGGTFVIELGLLDSGLPSLVVVREQPAAGARPTPPMLLELVDHREQGGYVVPRAILVHELDPAAAPLAFAAKPAQEIWIRTIDLRPALKPEDFRPLSGAGTPAPGRPR